MSLNGLDDVKVREAYDVANGEPGGWFLLKYASRDEVDILGTGNGGITDIRSAIAEYKEPSPLYGYLRYRRRSVIVKYIPEDCSRLVQARAAVHFNAICDQFTHNTTFEIADPKDLKDSKLSAACSLHAASGSSSSSNSSLRRRRLNEIAEEEEEEERERKRQSVVKEEGRATSSVYSDAPVPPSSHEPLVVLDPLQITDPSETTFASTKNLPDFTGAHVPLSPTKSDFNRRLSSQSARYEVYSSASYTHGRRVKLGPRPSLDANKRPVTAENFRPVAALPAGFKFFKGSKKGKSQEQDQSEQADHATPATIHAPGILSLSTDDHLPPRPATSSGASIKSTATSITPTREGKITPEKARLMKAMKLREKKLQDAKAELLSKPAENMAGVALKAETDKSLSVQADNTNPGTSNVDSITLPIHTTPKTDAHSRDTVLDSHPSSPGAASSTGIGDSTKASSLSDLTDETIHACKELQRQADEEAEQREPELSDIQKPDTTDLANTSHAETTDTNVSGDQLTKGDEKFAQIPGSDTNISQPTGAMATKSTERDDVMSNEAKSSTSPITPTTPSLKSKFSRKPVPVRTEPSPIYDEATGASAADHESPKPDVAISAAPEILLASPPNPLRHKATIDPIRTDLPVRGGSHIEASDPLDDDDLMDELQTATVQEAKPILVSKSPITPVFPSPGSPPRKDPRLPRAASNPMRGSLLMPVDVSQANANRSVSSGNVAYLNTLNRQPSNASIQSKKGNVGSSISQRIKALEALSGHPNEDRPRPTTPSSTFFTVRKQSTRDPSKSPSVVDRASSLTRQPIAPVERSREPTPEAADAKRERSGSVANRLTMFEGQNAPRGRPESIQVTARIIRSGTSPFSALASASRKPGEVAPAEFRQSTLLVDVQRAQSVAPQTQSERPLVLERPKTSVSEFHEATPSSEVVDKQAKRRSSMSLMKNFIKEHSPLSNKSTEQLTATSPGAMSHKSPGHSPIIHQNSSFARRLSTSSRRSSFNQEGDNASISAATRSSSRLSDSGSADDDKSLSDKKSKNRTSRFMRRLSNSFGGVRKAGSATISPTLQEEDSDQMEKVSILAKQQVSSPTIVAFMGDVNVQFPDNLLWKRRSMCLDASGFIFLSAIQGGASKGKDATGTKRFHLGDFRRPYIPDVEVQELPNSVVLDFLEGSSLQIACVDRTSQQNVLRTLQEAHQSHAARS